MTDRPRPPDGLALLSGRIKQLPPTARALGEAFKRAIEQHDVKKVCGETVFDNGRSGLSSEETHIIGVFIGKLVRLGLLPSEIGDVVENDEFRSGSDRVSGMSDLERQIAQLIVDKMLRSVSLGEISFAAVSVAEVVFRMAAEPPDGYPPRPGNLTLPIPAR